MFCTAVSTQTVRLEASKIFIFRWIEAFFLEL